MNNTINLLDNVSVAYNEFVIRQKIKSEENLNYNIDFDGFEEASDNAAYSFIWIEPKNTIDYRSKAKPVDLIEVKCLLFDFRFKIIDGKLIIKAIGHFNPDKFNGRNAVLLRPTAGTIIQTGFDKISSVEIPLGSSVELISKSVEELFNKCYNYYFIGS